MKKHTTTIENGHSTGTRVVEATDSVRELRRARDVQSLAPRLLTLQEAGRYLAVSYWQVRDYVLSGLLPRVELPRAFTQVKHNKQVFKVDAVKGETLRRILVDVRDCDNLIESSKQRMQEE